MLGEGEMMGRRGGVKPFHTHVIIDCYMQVTLMAGRRVENFAIKGPHGQVV